MGIGDLQLGIGNKDWELLIGIMGLDWGFGWALGLGLGDGGSAKGIGYCYLIYLDIS